MIKEENCRYNGDCTQDNRFFQHTVLKYYHGLELLFDNSNIQIIGIGQQLIISGIF